ncbi:MAG: sugar transferase [Candidatus Omnitrophica bacterium]|nr:sugar transferase [Candidatus Omnitrophota bacterium]
MGAGLTFPLGFFVGILVRATSPGPVFLFQPRAGQANRPFFMMKFRSMDLPGLHVTPLGRGLRATAADELPQLLNILRGEMSFVGPRPLLAQDAASVEAVPSGGLRSGVPPGLAGLTQLYGGKHPDPDARLKTDLEYARRSGFWFDLWILFCALGVSFRGGWEPSR